MRIAIDYRGEDCHITGCSIPAGSMTSHYHCPECMSPEPTSMIGHFVIDKDHKGGRVICNAEERREFLNQLE